MNKLSFKKILVLLTTPLFLVGGFFVANVFAGVAQVITSPATSITTNDAALNGINGPSDATGHSFWVSLATFDTSSPTIPAGVYSTPDLGAISADTSFSATLSSITTSGVPGNLPAITPNTTYYFVAWSLVGGTWYPGAILSFNTDPIPTPDCNGSSFDSFTLGSVNGQGGWGVTGSYDQAVVANTFSYPTFGCQTLRISDSVTSGSFGDQIFANPEVNGAGETDSTAAGFSIGTLQNHFEAQFDIASTVQSYQPGMHMSISPDRGDGSRMSYLRLEDSTDGINVFFDDVQSENAGFQAANFVETQVASNLNRSVPHTFKFVMDFHDGSSNDIVKVYIDGSLVHTGTSWENYYRFDTEASAEQTPRIVKTVLFRESGANTPADAGNGFLIDNYSISSSILNPNPTTLAATDDHVDDATINGTNGGYDAAGHSFWVSLAPFSTVSPTIPADVYSTPDLGAISAGAPFSATLSSVTTTGVPTNLPPITSSTRYYFVAWSLVNGTWYPGEMLSVDTVTPFENPPAPVVHISALPLTLTEGGTTVITYTTENIDGCTKAGDWSGSTEGSGSDTVGPLSAGTYTYTLNCNGIPGTHRGASGSVTVTVTSIPRGGGGSNTYGTPPSTPPVVGEVLGASTGPDQREIGGCDMRTTGFSITTGESCINNIPHSDGKVLGAETFQFYRTLKYGMTGDDVLELHKKLTVLGYYKGPIDDGFGYILEAAIKAFQKANPPLKMDGIVGPETREILNK
ncbi:MAG: peptidoglycan-binding domain-containing protein [Candidatus Paceibacterota bacterium]|jgi:hypothetical protein